MAGNAVSKFTMTYGYVNPLTADPSGGLLDQLKPRSYAASFQTGVTSNQIQNSYHDHQLALASGSSVTYVLSALPNSQSMSKVSQYFFEVVSLVGSGVLLSIDPTGANGWTNGVSGIVVIGPQSIFVRSEPDIASWILVNSGANDTLVVTNTGTGPIEYFATFLGQP